MPHISDLIQDIGQYHFELDEERSEMTTFMLPWGLYKYRRLPMGLNVSPDLFQEKMSKLFADLPYVRAYIHQGGEKSGLCYH